MNLLDATSNGAQRQRQKRRAQALFVAENLGIALKIWSKMSIASPNIRCLPVI